MPDYLHIERVFLTYAPVRSDWRAALELRPGTGMTFDYAEDPGVGLIVTLNSSGGGGSDHATLSNLAWTASAHTGTASRLAGFNGAGAAAYYTIGSDVMAYSADLAAIAGLTSAADKVPYATGPGTWAMATFNALGRSLVGAATQAAARAALGLDTGDSPTFNNLTVNGNLKVQGTTETTTAEHIDFAANYIHQNTGYTSVSAQTGGTVINYLPSATVTTISAAGFVAGVGGVSNPTVAVASTAGFSAGQVVQVSGSTSNDGFYEVDALLSTPTRIQIKGIGTVGTVEDWSFNQFTVEAGVGEVRAIAVAVWRTGTDGKLEQGAGSTVPFTYTDVVNTDDARLSDQRVPTDGSVTFAKMANLATQRVIGRNTGGTGVPEAVTLTQLLDWIGSAAKGDVLVRSASAWGRLPVGSDGQFLQADSAQSLGLSWVSAALAMATMAASQYGATTVDTGVGDSNVDPTVAEAGVIS